MKQPNDMGAAGAAFRKTVLADYELAPDEMVLLDNACSIMDELERIDDELAKSALVVIGGRGAVRAHPLLLESRQHRLALARVLGQLALPGEGESSATSRGVPPGGERSSAARKMAAARWSHRGA